jgi:hypothetical protein
MIAPDQGVLYANNPKEMADMAVQLASSAQHQSELSERGIELMNIHCNWQNQIRLFEKMLSQVQHV